MTLENFAYKLGLEKSLIFTDLNLSHVTEWHWSETIDTSHQIDHQSW